MQEERELLSRQQDAMREHAGPRELRTYPSYPSQKMYMYVFLLANTQEVIIRTVRKENIRERLIYGLKLI